MSEEKSVLTYKGHPLMRKDNLIYYGSMADSHIIMLQILDETLTYEVDQILIVLPEETEMNQTKKDKEI